ncbi:MAG: GAF domain-containing protein, partial [Bacteroidota bacterium]|nr:GAF domain-containing protein [Bacteroidota bacterium]
MTGLIFTIISVFSTIALAVILLLNNRKSVIHIMLFIFSLGFAGAIGSNYLTAYFTETNQVLIWIRMTIFFASILTPPFYIFIKNFPERRLVVSLREVVLIIALTLVSMLLAISSWMFTNVDIIDGNIVASQGPAFFYFIAVFMYYLVCSIILLIKKIRKMAGVQKAQLRYIFAGLIISFSFILFFNVVMTLIFKNSSLITLTNVAPLIFIGTVGYAIIKHRLMDIRIIVRKSLVYFSALVTVMLISLGLMMLNIKIFQNTIPAMVSGPLVLLIGVIVFNPLKKKFEKIANKYFFTSLYNYQATLEELGKKLTYTINLSEIVDSIIITIKNTMHLDRVGVLLYDKHSSNYKIYRTEGFTESNGISLVRNNFLTNHLMQTRQSILYQELELLQNNDNGDKAEIAKLKTNMQRIEAHICLPLLVKNKLIGIIVLGQKITKDAYTKEDLHILEAVSNQASVAIENAKLYDEVQDFNKNLKSKV